MENLTRTSLGLWIAYVLPGSACLYAIALFYEELFSVLRLSLSIDKEFFLSIVLFSTVLSLGLIVNAFNWVILQQGVFRSFGIRVSNVSKDSSAGGRELRLSALDENMRYAQFYGNMFLIMPFLSYQFFCRMAFAQESHIYVSVLIYVFLQIVLIFTAAEAYKRYIICVVEKKKSRRITYA